MGSLRSRANILTEVCCFEKLNYFYLKQDIKLSPYNLLSKAVKKKSPTFAVGSSVNDSPVWNIPSLLDLVNPEYGQQFMQLPKLGYFLTWRQRANQAEDGLLDHVLSYKWHNQDVTKTGNGKLKMGN